MRKFFGIFLLLLSFYIFAHIYIADLMSRFFNDKEKFRSYIYGIGFVVLFVLFLRVYFENSLYYNLVQIAYFWIGVIFLSFFVFLFGDIFSRLFSLPFKDVFKLSFLLFLIILLFSIFSAFKFPNVNNVVLYSNKVDRDYSFFFFSDTHIDNWFKKRIFKKIFYLINNSDADFIIFGGDFADYGFRMSSDLKRISNKPAFFVFGNHDYYFGSEKIENIISEMGFLNITSSSVVFGKLNVVGIDDIKTRKLSYNDVDKLLGLRYKPELFNIVISHQPIYFKEIANRYDVFMLSGHTHCGQIFPFHLFTKFLYPFFCGMYEYNGSYIYVSSGASVWGPQMRFLSNSEILRVVIKKT